MTQLAFEIHVLEREIADLIAAFPELADDDELRADTIEGQTDAYGFLSHVIGLAQDAGAISMATAARISTLAARKAAAERRQDAMRRLALRLMQSANLKKAVLPDATLSVTKGRESVEILDETMLPRWALRVTEETAPDKKAIKEFLDLGKDVPGARIKVSDETLTVRVA